MAAQPATETSRGFSVSQLYGEDAVKSTEGRQYPRLRWNQTAGENKIFLQTH